VRFLVVGDFGIGSRVQERIRNQMMRRPADLILTTGDNAYMAGTFDEYEEQVFDVYRVLFSQTPVFPTPGNHDYRTERARPYLTNFFLPENAALPEDRERYYSFDWGAVHFVAVDTEAPLRESPGKTENMLTWLDNDLAATTRPWIVVYFHRPAYSTSLLRGGDLMVRNRITPILEKHKVPIVFAGHNHVYERFHPIREGKPVPLTQGGVVYVTTGGGGAPSYIVQPDSLLAQASNVNHFLAVQADACEFGYQALDDQGNVIDRFAMRQCP
jgi:3',5'-cyclic AMP phosphodiesterase CpdA